MGNKHLSSNKQNGVFYTPLELADFLVSKIGIEDIKSVLEPASGNGALVKSLLARKKDIDSADYSLTCIDIEHSLEDDLVDNNIIFIQEDYLMSKLKGKFDLVLTNPPYVKHQYQDKYYSGLEKVYSNYNLTLNKQSDLWVHFIVKSMSHLNIGGQIAAILPWSFLQADYAIEVRKLILKKFKKVFCLGLKNSLFANTEERVVCLWLSGYGMETEQLSGAEWRFGDSTYRSHPLSIQNWTGKRVLLYQQNNVDTLLYRLCQLGFKPLENFGTCKLGIVTGANSFFVKKRTDLDTYFIKESDTIPILTSSKDLGKYSIDGLHDLKRMLRITDQNENRYKNLILEGEMEEYDKRSHCKVRRKWYQILDSKIADAFYPYRFTQYGFITSNDHGIQSLNSVHRIYFNELSTQQYQSILISSFTKYSQISLRSVSKSYGKGVFKVEPGILKNLLLYDNATQDIAEVYYDIMIDVKNKNIISAIDKATHYFNIILQIPEETVNEVNRLFNLMLEDD